MSDFYIGQIMPAGFGFPPRGWAACNGQLLPIAQNQALFSLLGTQYGGDGRVSFGLPDLRGRTPVDAGTSADSSWQPTPYVQGEMGGVENVTLLSSNLPMHSHPAQASSTAGNERNPTNALYSGSGSEQVYAPSSGAQAVLAPQTIGMTGGNQPHANMQPYLVINFNIALTGIYPSRS